MNNFLNHAKIQTKSRPVRSKEAIICATQYLPPSVVQSFMKYFFKVYPRQGQNLGSFGFFDNILSLSLAGPYTNRQLRPHFLNLLLRSDPQNKNKSNELKLKFDWWKINLSFLVPLWFFFQQSVATVVKICSSCNFGAGLRFITGANRDPVWVTTDPTWENLNSCLLT